MLIFVTALISLINSSLCGEILVILPFRGTSHFHIFERFLDELSLRGHHVTVASYFPKQKPFPNYTSISFVDENYKIPLKGFYDFKQFGGNEISVWTNMYLIYDLVKEYDHLFELKEFMSLPDKKYDLVITEYFNSDVILGMVYKINAPFILVIPGVHYPWQSYTIGNSINPSYIGHPFSYRLGPDRMTFFERISNTVQVYTSIIAYELFFRYRDTYIAEKYLGPLPPLREIVKNASLYMVNSEFIIHGSKPLMPNSISIGGIAIKTPKPLSKDFQKVLDDSKGAIYFSMGSVLKCDTLSEKKEKAFIKVFSELNQTVLWKRETPLNPKTKNIITNGWYPQRDILAHPKVELFISHGGILGTNEAIASGVPLVVIPIFADQHHNAKSLETIGVAVGLNFDQLNEDNIRKSVNKVLNDPSFKQNANKVKDAFLDRPMSPLDTAVYWVEYVIRHKGAPYLKSAALDLTWYQYHNLDVYAVMVLIIYLIYLTFKFILKLSFKLICSVFYGGKKIKQKKH